MHRRLETTHDLREPERSLALPGRGRTRRDDEHGGEDGGNGGEAAHAQDGTCCTRRSASPWGVPCARREDLRYRRRTGGLDDRGSAPRRAQHHRDRPRSRSLTPLSYRYDVATVEANGASRRSLADAGVSDADLVIACTSRDEANLVAAIFARIEAPRATTVIRTSNVEYIELWREGRLDVDFVVSSEIETAHAITRVIGVPAAVQTDVFADGQVQMVEYDVSEHSNPDVLGKPLRSAGWFPATHGSRASSAATR